MDTEHAGGYAQPDQEDRDQRDLGAGVVEQLDEPLADQGEQLVGTAEQLAASQAVTIVDDEPTRDLTAAPATVNLVGDWLDRLPAGTDLRGDPLTDEQTDDLGDPRHRPLRVELRDPFGQVIASWVVDEGDGREYGGAYSLGAQMQVRELRAEYRVPFILPGMDRRAPYYFSLWLPRDEPTAVEVVDQADEEQPEAQDTADEHDYDHELSTLAAPTNEE
jgi:hypothetical protein